MKKNVVYSKRKMNNKKKRGQTQDLLLCFDTFFIDDSHFTQIVSYFILSCHNFFFCFYIAISPIKDINGFSISICGCFFLYLCNNNKKIVMYVMNKKYGR